MKYHNLKHSFATSFENNFIKSNDYYLAEDNFISNYCQHVGLNYDLKLEVKDFKLAVSQLNNITALD